MADQKENAARNGNGRSQPTPPFPEQPLDPPGLEHTMDPRPHFEAPRYRGSGKLEGKVAVVTGGDSGIGRAVAVLFAREGANVAVMHLEEEEVDAAETVQAVEAEGGEAISIAGDVSSYSFCQSAIDEVLDHFGQIDILVNNAAFQNHVDGIRELSVEQWRKTFSTNIDGYFYLIKAAEPHLKSGAAIINTGSILGLVGTGELIDYSATKGAIHALTKALAQDLIGRGIRVNCVSPGPVWTPLNPAEREPEEVENFGGKTPMGRPAQPEEIAPAYVYFASNVDSSYVTGEILTLLGGNTRAG